MLQSTDQNLESLMDNMGSAEKKREYNNFLNDFEEFLSNINYFDSIAVEVVKRILDFLFKSQKSENIDFIIDLLKNLKRGFRSIIPSVSVLFSRNLSQLSLSGH